MSATDNANLAPTWIKSDDQGGKEQVTSHGEGQANTKPRGSQGGGRVPGTAPGTQLTEGHVRG